jgi:hypothetical protein
MIGPLLLALKRRLRGTDRPAHDEAGSTIDFAEVWLGGRSGRWTEAYYRLLLRFAAWWAIAVFIVAAVLLVCVAIDWTTDVHWGYPWYSLPFLAAFAAFAYLVRRMALSGLRFLDSRKNPNT